MASKNNKLPLLMPVSVGTSFARVAAFMAALTTQQDTITGIKPQTPTLQTPTHCPHFPMTSRFQSFTNPKLTPSGAKSCLLGSSTEGVSTCTATSIDNVESKIHAFGGQDHHLSVTIDQWTLGCVLIDLASWVVLNGPWISRLLTICSNMEQSLTLEAALPAPPPPPSQKPRQWKQPSPEPQQAVISRSLPSSSVSSSSQHYHHPHQQ